MSHASTFAPDYLSARRAFLEAATAESLDIHSIRLNGYYGPEGEDLFTDIAIHRTGSRRAIITESGLHGIEGFAGSALQRQCIVEDDPALSESFNADVIHVHALNPYGFAWSRRADQDNIDGNRNFFPGSRPANPNPAYARYADLLVPKEPGKDKQIIADSRLLDIIQREGMDKLKDVISAGQAVDEKGLFFIGTKPSTTRETWLHIIREHLSGYDAVTHPSLHTGLGERGAVKVYTMTEPGEALDNQRRIWGDRLEVMNSAMHTADSSRVSGDISNAWTLVAPADRPRRATTVAFEFGTVPVGEILKAMRAEHAAFAQNLLGPERDQARAMMRQAFAPQDGEWEQAVLRNGREVYRQAFALQQ